MSNKFHTVGIPESLYLEVKEMIFKKDWLGYRSVNEYVRTAVRNQYHRDSMREKVSGELL